MWNPNRRVEIRAGIGKNENVTLPVSFFLALHWELISLHIEAVNSLEAKLPFHCLHKLHLLFVLEFLKLNRIKNALICYSVWLFFYFQRLAAIKQSLNAQNISFFMRGGKWVLVALGSSDSGKLPLPLPPLLSPVSLFLPPLLPSLFGQLQ